MIKKIFPLRMNKGFTLVELLASLAIMALISTIIFTSFNNWKDANALSKDTDTIVSVLREARNQTLSSKNLTVYGVHFATTTVSLFIGSTYTSATTSNKVFNLSENKNNISVVLSGGGNDVIFNRLTGETSQNGTVLISSPRLNSTKTITIYKTGVTEVD